MGFNYCGGIPQLPKADVVQLAVISDELVVISAFKKDVKIPVSSIKNVVIKTDEQISNDVTLTRLLALGVLAFGLKKKNKNTVNYLIVDYTDSGIDCTAIFSGDKVPKIYSQLFAARQKYLAANPPEPAPSAMPADDVYSEIEKLHGLMEKGIITADEFTSKKQQLLNI